MNELELIIKIYVWLGIDLRAKSVKTRIGRILQLVQCVSCVSFPLFLHVSAIFLQVVIISEMETIDYSVFLDTLLIFVPCFLWWSIFKQRNSIRFLLQFMLQVKQRHIQLKNSSKNFIIGAIMYWSTFMIFSLFMTLVRHNLIYSDKDISFSWGHSSFCTNSECRWRNITKLCLFHAQELLMSFLFFIMYFSLCCNIINILEYYIKTLKQLYDSCSSQILRTFLMEYEQVVKFAKAFSSIFSLPLLLFVCYVMCNLSMLFLDILSAQDKTYFGVIDVVFQTISFVGITAVLCFCADEIPTRVDVFKEVLYDLKAGGRFKNNLDDINIIDVVLNRETLIITVFRMIQFDRSFLLKLIAAVFAHSVIYHQLSEMKQLDKCENVTSYSEVNTINT